MIPAYPSGKLERFYVCRKQISINENCGFGLLFVEHGQFNQNLIKHESYLIFFKTYEYL